MNTNLFKDFLSIASRTNVQLYTIYINFWKSAVSNSVVKVDEFRCALNTRQAAGCVSE